MFKFILPLLFASTSHAGKLAEGVFGVKWGAAPEFPAPMEGCIHNPEPGVEWTCEKQVGTVPVAAAWGYKHEHVFITVLIAKGDSECSMLMDTLTQAWGKSIPLNSYDKSRMAERAWKDGQVIAHWTWNQFTKACKAAAISLPDKEYVEEQDKKVAAMGVEDL